ncbi:hypothetical protein DFH06DRAFT_565787 [Mycena polygramma]|nr:hypothetical protein DFH06DRAFT_565787 [Mycena polygramma]
MADLPMELLEIVAKELEHDPAIFSLRLVSKAFNTAATPLAFRVVVAKDNVKSAEAISFLQGCDESVTGLVREVVFRAEYDDETLGEPGRAALKTVFSRLAKFPKLQSLRFSFYLYIEDEYEDPPEIPTDLSFLQTTLFHALAANPPPLVSLTLHYMLATPSDIYTQEDFLRIIRSLQKLDISVLSAYYKPSIVRFWDTTITHLLRSANALTALTLNGPPRLASLNGAFLPRLTSLSLYGCVFGSPERDADVIQFILRHNARLTRLQLSACSIDSGSLEARPWHAVFALFEAKLHRLRAFVFDFVERDVFDYTYVDYWKGGVSRRHRTPIGDQHRDFSALESLQAVMVSRRRSEDESRDAA